MINKHKILNAISEGIKTGFKFSSNSTIDNSSFIDFFDSKINNIESFNIGKIERQDFVDLGLSVKWAKCNIGATCQNTPNSWYGNYYAWGELAPKHNYSKDSYDLSLYEKYNENSFHVLLHEDDIVTLTYYGINKFRMPTKKEFRELLDETKIKNEWKTDYKGIEGLNGREFTSLINGNFIFIPTVGYFKDSKHYHVDDSCLLWSSSLYSDNFFNAWKLDFNSNGIYVSMGYRSYGFSVRSICS